MGRISVPSRSIERAAHNAQYDVPEGRVYLMRFSSNAPLPSGMNWLHVNLKCNMTPWIPTRRTSGNSVPDEAAAGVVTSTLRHAGPRTLLATHPGPDAPRWPPRARKGGHLVIQHADAACISPPMTRHTAR